MRSEWYMKITAGTIFVLLSGILLTLGYRVLEVVICPVPVVLISDNISHKQLEKYQYQLTDEHILGSCQC